MNAARHPFVVTGAAGFLGSHLVEALLARGDDVVGVDCFTDYYPRELKEANIGRARSDPAFTLVEDDLASMELGPLVHGSAGVFHLAAQPGVRGSWSDSFAVYTRDNIVATQRLFEACSASGTRVVFASSSSVYGDAERFPTPEDVRPRPVSPYGVTKLACEALAAAYARSRGLDVVSLRYFSVYGPRQRPDMAFARIFAALASGKPFPLYGSGEQSRDFTYVGDAVAATFSAMEAGARGAVYNVGGGSETSLREVIGLCESLARSSLSVTSGPAAPGDVRRTAADTTRLRRELGWQPRTSLAEGLAAQLAARPR